MSKIKLWGILIILVIGVWTAYYLVAGVTLSTPCNSLEVPMFYPDGLYNAVIYKGSIVLETPHLGKGRLNRWQSLTINHEGLWIATTKLMHIKNGEASFQYSYMDTREKDATTCSFQLSLQEVTILPEANEGFTTQNPESMYPILLQPEELSGQWVLDSFEEITNDLPKGMSELSDEIPYKDRIWTSIEKESSDYKMGQDVRVYVTKEDAEAIFEAEYYPDKRFNAVNLPDEATFQPVSKNYILGCTLLPADGRWCYFKEQYGQYIISIHVPIDGESVTLQDWEEMGRLIETKLIHQVEQVQ